MIRALWLDDDACSEVMKSRRDTLARSGILIEGCADLSMCKQFFSGQNYEYDVILVDMIMPPTSNFTLADTRGGTETGLAVIEKIRESLPHLPIIVVSVRGDTELRARLNALGVADYIRKPCSTKHLAEVIRRNSRTRD